MLAYDLALSVAAAELVMLVAICSIPSCRNIGCTRHFLPLGCSFLILQTIQVLMWPYLVTKPDDICPPMNRLASALLALVFSTQPTLIAWLAARPPHATNGQSGIASKHQHTAVLRFMLWMGLVNLGFTLVSMGLDQYQRVEGRSPPCTYLSAEGHVVWSWINASAAQQPFFPNSFFVLFCWGSAVAYVHDKAEACAIGVFMMLYFLVVLCWSTEESNSLWTTAGVLLVIFYAVYPPIKHHYGWTTFTSFSALLQLTPNDPGPPPSPVHVGASPYTTPVHVGAGPYTYGAVGASQSPGTGDSDDWHL